MIILTLRTDKPEANIAIYEDSRKLTSVAWVAHRQLVQTINDKIQQQLELCDKTINDIEGIVVFEGPGSFTGLRIGVSVGNALAYGLQIAIVSETGKSWIKNGVKRLIKGDTDSLAVPNYGAPVFTTLPKK